MPHSQTPCSKKAGDGIDGLDFINLAERCGSGASTGMWRPASLPVAITVHCRLFHKNASNVFPTTSTSVLNWMVLSPINAERLYRAMVW